MKRDALFNMIEQQIRPWDVSNPAVLKLLHDLPRAGFLPASHQAFAYVDTELPLVIDGVDTGTQLLTPRVVARIVQAVDVQKNETVAQVGLGDGYMAALLARFAKTVTVYELNETILHFAQRNLNQHHVRNVNYELGDGLKLSTEKFDVLVLAGSVAHLTHTMKQRIHVGGRLFAIIGTAGAPTMHAVLVHRVGESDWTQEVLFETIAPALTQSDTRPTFVF
ncbi:protein-L-isoaspartate O-methyltransferase family protein [Hydromonas duriensis]|uniref:Protein-L-isoaspartate O-methyltransferase n=1 Tax=Hydromonas duriensis TaxID=1527608 RepID=A0A4V3DJU3_9BURK|nr:methyltransferase domain-containing protein [Hydromonas duriensis]TDR31435.1 protein-L-isoaspartate(D-aspartate) O-methyltransferase [Hydromonas duriensis]